MVRVDRSQDTNPFSPSRARAVIRVDRAQGRFPWSWARISRAVWGCRADQRICMISSSASPRWVFRFGIGIPSFYTLRYHYTSV